CNPIALQNGRNKTFSVSSAIPPSQIEYQINRYILIQIVNHLLGIPQQKYFVPALFKLLFCKRDVCNIQKVCKVQIQRCKPILLFDIICNSYFHSSLLQNLILQQGSIHTELMMTALR